MRMKALISVFEKKGSRRLARELVNLGWGIISTGGTKRYLEEAGIPEVVETRLG